MDVIRPLRRVGLPIIVARATEKATELLRATRVPGSDRAPSSEQLGLFLHHPGPAERYAALTRAADVESALPSHGDSPAWSRRSADTGSNMQRYQAVVTSGLSATKSN